MLLLMVRTKFCVRNFKFLLRGLPQIFILLIFSEIILFTCNLLNPSYERPIDAAHAKGIGTLSMNPIAGGLLAQASPLLDTLAERVGAKTIPELAIRFLLSNPGITTNLPSGLHATSQIRPAISRTTSGSPSGRKISSRHWLALLSTVMNAKRPSVAQPAGLT